MNPLQHQNKTIDELSKKIDVLTEEVLLLDDEISLEQARLKKIKLPQPTHKLELQDKLKKEKQALEELKQKVEHHLELTEEMEENDLLDETKVEALLSKAEALQDQEIESLKAEIKAKQAELEKKH